jgi:hypothetical protein
MGRCGEVVVRTWNLAHKNKVERGPLPEDEELGTKACRFPDHQIGQFANLNAAHYMADTLRQGWIDGASAQMVCPPILNGCS